MTNRRKFITAVGTLGVGTLAGCAGDDENNGTPTATDIPLAEQTAKLSASDGDSDDDFGWSVAVSGDGSTALLAAPGDEHPNGEDARSAYVFSRVDGTWSEEAKLTANDGPIIHRLRSLVAMAGDGSTALLAAPGDDPNGEGAGSAYVFSRGDGTWSEEAKLSASDGDSDDDFGWSVAMAGEGSTALVGAIGDEDPNGTAAGSAYVFSRGNGTWSEEAKLSASDGDSGDHFGSSVAMAGDGPTAIVGAPEDEDPNGTAAGSAYVFSRGDGTWSEEAKLSASDGDSDDLFGFSVAVSGDGSTALLGAPGDEDPNGTAAGSAYVFSRGDGTWSEGAKLSASDGDSDDLFGGSVAMAGDGSTALLGAPVDEEPNGDLAGSAYVFSRADGTWSEKAKLSASDGDSNDGFGFSVAVSGDGSTALLGAPADEEPNGTAAGSAYVFE